MLMTNPIIDSYLIDEIKKERELQQIINVIAPEHDKIHLDNKNKLKNDEKILIDQMVSHCHAFSRDFKNVAQGDWVRRAMLELKKLSYHLRKIQDIKV